MQVRIARAFAHTKVLLAASTMLVYVPLALGSTAQAVAKEKATDVERAAPRANTEQALSIKQSEERAPRRRGPGAHPPEGPASRRADELRPAGRNAPEPLWNRLSEEEQFHIERFIEEHFPLMYEELQQIKREHPDRFQKRIRKVAPEIRELMEMLDVDPQRASLVLRERRLDLQIRHTVHRFHTSRDEGEREDLRNHLHHLVEQAFDCRMQRREREILDLEARINELRERLFFMEEAREARVNRELEDLLREPERQRGPDKERKARAKKNRQDRDENRPNRRNDGARKRRPGNERKEQPGKAPQPQPERP